MTIPQLIKKYERRGLLLDTVLVVLLVVGAYDRKLIGRDKRLTKYIPEDLECLDNGLNYLFENYNHNLSLSIQIKYMGSRFSLYLFAKDHR